MALEHRDGPISNFRRGGLAFNGIGAIGAVVARFVHTEEVTGSNPVSPTKKMVRSAHRAGRTIVVSAVGPLYSSLSEPRERVFP